MCSCGVRAAGVRGRLLGFLWRFALQEGKIMSASAKGIQNDGSFLLRSPVIFETDFCLASSIDFDVVAVLDEFTELLTNFPSVFKNFSNLSFFSISASSFKSLSLFSLCLW